MKNLLSVLFMLPFLALGQSKIINAFYEIPFASSRQVVLQSIKNRGGEVDLKRSTDNKVVVSGLNYGKFQTSTIIFSFEKDQLYQTNALIPQNGFASTVELFNSIKLAIDSVYGKGRLKKEFLLPYKEGDGSELVAIKRGFANYNCEWMSLLTNMHKALISLTINKTYVELVYEDSTVIEDFLRVRRNTLKQHLPK